ncbi:MAG: hypothetical protein ACXACU_17545 [Candidatus Hodarchaeales archaeon]
MGFKIDFRLVARISATLVIIGSFNFLFISSIAALLYPGGYKYFEYVFSDLGRVIAFNSELNRISSALFSFAVATTAFLEIPFWLIVGKIFTFSQFEKKISILGSILGLITVPIQICLAFFPVDTQVFLHAIFAQSFFLLTGITILVYSILIYNNDHYHNYFAYIGFTIFLIVILFVIGIYGIFQAFMQKMIIYCYIIWISAQAYHIWLRTKVKTSITVPIST